MQLRQPGQGFRPAVSPGPRGIDNILSDPEARPWRIGLFLVVLAPILFDGGPTRRIRLWPPAGLVALWTFSRHTGHIFG
ncbi:hypothetical protein GCM10010331_17690 [Streptomyces xanthochromogenes]|nr:hypothetical protein GCM10010331_17690 [Streptomyces xanthochromogenes]